MNSREQKQREKILNGAQEMFMTRGFTNTSTAQLAKHIGMSKTTLYKHFPTKEALLEDALSYTLDDIEKQLSQMLEDSKPPILDKIHNFMQVIVTHVQQLKLDSISDIKHHAPHIYSMVTNRQDQIIDKYALKLFNDAVEHGVFRKDLDQQIAIDMIIQSVKVLGSPEYLQHSPHTFESIFQHVFKLVIEGNLNKEIKE
ncbi:TetR/AcrR family transcriptional regulator [Planococcus halocryophilus]|uniref:HTH tetR-type domain-containing protein n=1 Tax=Planococcus halocryophilus TaxID=1215089 RepID=A0A1C7DPZ9_9BACL|nr:TetR/AcrR family transcriptional regulator [Planococcus halocryophilus]ANU13341.1 hypothetical protein BBI08_05595 [Planococcus halocryophilus]